MLDAESLPPDLCVPNIGPREQRRRVLFGVAALIISAVLLGALLLLGLGRWWRFVLLVPLWGAAIGVFQAAEKTWVSLAARGARNLDAGQEPILDPGQLVKIRRQARRVHVKAGLTALALTALCLAIPD